MGKSFFYTNCQSRVIVNGHLSEWFYLQRGCRQGDPLSQYLFVVCAEILAILVRQHGGIKGISIGNVEFLVSQYDTSFILEGSQESLEKCMKKKVKEKSRECHNHKPQPFTDPKRKRKLTNPNKHKPNKRKKSTKISSLFPKRGNRNTKRTEKHKNKMTHGKTYNKSPRRINHKATKSKTNTGTSALERPAEQTTGGFRKR